MQFLPKLLAGIFLLIAGSAQAASQPGSALRCKAQKVGPFLDFEYRFSLGFWFHLPVKQFWGSPVGLDLEIEVKPVKGTPGESMWLDDRIQGTDPVPDGSKGEIYFSYGVSVGPGEYQAVWWLRDDTGRTCGGSNGFKAALSRRDRGVGVTLDPGEIVDAGVYMFRPENPIPRPQLHAPRRLKVFLCLDVLGRRRRVIRPRLLHVLPLVAALRQLGRSSSFNEFSVVVFSFEDQDVLFRQDYGNVIDFRSLSGMIDRLKPETVDVSDLLGGSEMNFFEELISAEILRSEAPDGVVFVGREMNFGKRLPKSTLERIRDLGASFAFLDASRYAWRGAMGNLVRALDGREYLLRRPGDLARAIESFEGQVLLSTPQ